MFQLEDAFRTDNAVKAFRRIDPDELGPMTPEHEALAAGVDILEEEFGPWYGVAWRLAMRGTRRPVVEVSPWQIECAYETYRRGQGEMS